MNQFHDAESENVGEVGAVGRQGPPSEQLNPPIHPPEIPVQEPVNLNIVNEYNSFNLANVTSPVAPKWRTSETLLDDFRKFK